MQLAAFVDIQMRRARVDDDGWYEPATGELHASDARAARSLRPPVSDAYEMNAPLGVVPDVPNGTLLELNVRQRYPQLAAIASRADGQAAAVAVHDTLVRLYKKADARGATREGSVRGSVPEGRADGSLFFIGRRRGPATNKQGLLDLVRVEHPSAQWSVGTDAAGDSVVWKAADDQQYLHALFRGAESAAGYFNAPWQTYRRNVRERNAWKLHAACEQRGAVITSRLSLRGDVVASCHLEVGPFVHRARGFVYTTDDGLRMGVPHMCARDRIADLGNANRFSGRHRNVLSRCARVHCAGRPLSNAEGRLAPCDGNDPDGDGGTRMALLAALEAMAALGESDVTTVVFEVANPLDAARICGMLHAFPINFNGFAKDIDRGSRVTFDGRDVWSEKDGQRKKLELLACVAHEPPVFRDAADCKRHPQLYAYMQTTSRPTRSSGWDHNEVFRHRRTRYLNRLAPVVLAQTEGVQLPERVLDMPVIPISVRGKRAYINNLTAMSDVRLAILSNIAYRCTERIEGDFILMRPTPSPAELRRLKENVLLKGDLMFVA